MVSGEDAPAGTELPAVGAAKLGKAIAFGPEVGSCEAAVIWLHGFGDKPDGWAQMLRPLRRAASQKLRWLHLRAPKVKQPGYRNQELPAWGQFFDPKCIHVGSKDYEDKDEAGIYAASVLAVHEEIAKVRAEGIPVERVVLAGFSQGAALALEAGLLYRHRLAGVIVLSGWLTPRGRAALAARPAVETPYLVCHGTADDMVGFDCGEAAADALRRTLGEAPVQFHSFPDLEHASCSQEMKIVASFLHKATAEASAELEIPEWDRGGPGAESEDGDISAAQDDMSDIGYVRKGALDQLRELVGNSGEISEELLRSLTKVEGIEDAEAMVAVDFDKLGDDFEDISAAVRGLGARGVAQKFLEAADAPDVAQLEPITVAEWKQQAAEADSGDSAEEGEEEEGTEGDEELPEDPEQADGTAQEVEGPEAKRPRTS